MLDPQALVRRIRHLQQTDGRILWVDGGLFDPWNHCEAAMGLICADECDAARRALDHLVETQNTDGSWRADMGCAVAMTADGQRLSTDNPPQIVDMNFCAYPAVAVWRLYLQTQARADLERYAPMVAAAIEFVTAYQRADGAFPWRAQDDGEAADSVEALIAGSASIYKSLECAIRIERALDREAGGLERARARLGAALRTQPDAFAEKSSHAMDWYYPTLCGVIARQAGRRALAAHWRDFVAPRWGCRCVDDQPWATAAETAELALSCLRVGAMRAADRLIAALEEHCDAEGALFMGRQFALDVHWPDEKPSWTAGAALMALDARNAQGPGARLFLDSLAEPARELT